MYELSSVISITRGKLRFKFQSKFQNQSSEKGPKYCWIPKTYGFLVDLLSLCCWLIN